MVGIGSVRLVDLERGRGCPAYPRQSAKAVLRSGDLDVVRRCRSRGRTSTGTRRPV